MSSRQQPQPRPVDLLWTGGWDSTFRLLDLLHGTSAIIRPWYVIDEERRSTGAEIRAMRRIREAIRRRSPARAERLLPTRYRGVDEIASDAEVDAWYRGLGRRMRIGVQYNWLSRLADQEGLDGLELCVHDPARGIGAAIAPHVTEVSTPHGPTLRVVERPEDRDLALFHPFAFPLLGWSKLKMEHAARERGFADLMEDTWFCHRPRRGEPCGRCNPCQQVLQEDMGRRMPPVSRALGRLRRWRKRMVGLFRGSR